MAVFLGAPLHFFFSTTPLVGTLAIDSNMPNRTLHISVGRTFSQWSRLHDTRGSSSYFSLSRIRSIVKFQEQFADPSTQALSSLLDISVKVLGSGHLYPGQAGAVFQSAVSLYHGHSASE